MSTILEALRRAQQDREQAQGAVPGLHAHAPATEPARRRPTAWLALGLLALGGLLAGAWWLGRSAPQQVLRVAPEPAPTLPVAMAPPPPQAPPSSALIAAPTPAPVPASTASPVPPRPVPVAKPPLSATAPASAPIPSVQQLGLPPLQVGGAMHSPDAQLRSLIVNGQLLREGDEVLPGWVLEHIEPRRAVLKKGEQRASLGF